MRQNSGSPPAMSRKREGEARHDVLHGPIVSAPAAGTHMNQTCLFAFSGESDAAAVDGDGLHQGEDAQAGREAQLGRRPCA